jgi:two-component system, response regulator PdtaR
MTAPSTIEVLIVEDEVLLAEELAFLVREAGLREVGRAMSSGEALAMAARLTPDLALVDVHLKDGPTGVETARAIVADCGAVVLFMTANVTRLPADYAGACGVIGKPYTERAVTMALAYLETCLREGRAPGPPPLGLSLAPRFRALWGGGLAETA